MATGSNAGPAKVWLMPLDSMTPSLLTSLDEHSHGVSSA